MLIKGTIKVQLSLIINHAIIGRIKHVTPKITEEVIIDLDRFFGFKNSPRYAKTIEVEPEMQSPLRNLNRIICHKLLAKLDRNDVKNAVNAATMRAFLLP